MQLMHKTQKAVEPVEKKVRPERVAARRAKELLCVFKEHYAETEDALWLDEINVDEESIPVFHEKDPTRGMPLIDNIEKWCQSPWNVSHDK